MSEFLFILVIFLGLIVLGGAGLVFFLSKKSKKNVDESQSNAIRDLDIKMTNLITGQLKEIRDSQSGASQAMYRQIDSFTREATKIREELKQVQTAVKDVSSFQEIFKSPKLRGQWGEASLEHILSQHFPQELYKIQHLFSSGEQVDAVLKLPNGRVLPIDSKFPSENFGRMVESQGEEREAYQKRFVEDVKSRINEIASKYILPSESTTDFALMYIPAEAVFYEIVNNIGREVDLASYAQSKKVILTSPNTIYLTLRTIEHWFKDTQISRQTQEILKRLNRVHQDASKLLDDFRRLGSHLKNAISAYDNSEKRLNLFSDKVERLLETPAPEKSSVRGIAKEEPKN
ncbi:MAG: DNA recombination protein RmuC [bacterium]|nr:DNA recombination protein RmuC [bacterium]